MTVGIMKLDKRKKEYDQAKELYEKGLSIEQVAKFYGRTRQAMWQWMKSRGVEMRPQARVGKENHFYRGGKLASDKAQNLLESALSKGIAHRFQHCEQCGGDQKFKDGRSAIQAHHADYNKPLDVIWLCQKCHHNWHKTFKAIERR